MGDLGKIFSMLLGVTISIFVFSSFGYLLFLLIPLLGIFIDALNIFFSILGYHVGVMYVFKLAVFANLITYLFIRVRSFIA